LIHKDIPYFGASPDGITENGIMLEIKCPYKRKIDGGIPEQYFYQVQGQLEVCGLNECDYFECAFDELSENAFYADLDPQGQCLTKDWMEKGSIIKLPTDDGEGKYHYSPVGATQKQIIRWKNKVMINVPSSPEITYWKLRETSCRRVYRDKEFMEVALENAYLVKQTIDKFKADRELYETEMKSRTVNRIIDFDAIKFQNIQFF
jgi:hypothetical protein